MFCPFAKAPGEARREEALTWRALPLDGRGGDVHDADGAGGGDAGGGRGDQLAQLAGDLIRAHDPSLVAHVLDRGAVDDGEALLVTCSVFSVVQLREDALICRRKGWN